MSLMNSTKSMVKILLNISEETKMEYRISARVNGTMVSRIVDATDKDDAAQYGYCMWGVEDVWVEEVQE